MERAKEPWDAVFWWELRRIPFNVVLLVTGMASVLSIFAVGSQIAAPGHNFIAPLLIPLGIVGYAIAANAFYTLGWVSELLWSGGDTSRTAAYRNRTFYVGLSGSVALTLTPAVLAALIWILAPHH